MSLSAVRRSLSGKEGSFQGQTIHHARLIPYCHWHTEPKLLRYQSFADETSHFQSSPIDVALHMNLLSSYQLLNIIIIILSFDIAPFPYKHAQRRITFHCQRIDVDIHIVN